MKSDKLLEIVGEAKESYVLSALDSRNGKKRPQRQQAISRTLLIAAVIAMMLLLVGCAVIYALSLQDMKVGEFTHTIPRHLDENGNKVYETEVTKDILSLQGYVGTPGYLAYQEWNSFKGTHDAPENEPEIPMENRLDYLSYGCLSQKEIDKVDEICEKYNLHKLGIAWMEESPEITFDALGIDGLVLPKTPAEVHYYQGYYYWDGTFDIPFELTLTAENSLWKHPLDMRMRYVMKAAFDSVGVEVDSVENYKEWTYTTRQGVKVLLALSDNGALMIADRTDAFLTVLVSNTTTGEDRLSQKGLEAVAEVINFGVDPGVVDVEAAQARYDDGLERAREAQKISMELYAAFNSFELDDISQMNVTSRYLEQSELTEETLTNRAANPLETVEDHVFRRIMYGKLHKAIEQLTEVQRRRLILYYFGGYTYDQIAQMEGCKHPAIMKSVAAAEKNIKKYYSE